MRSRILPPLLLVILAVILTPARAQGPGTGRPPSPPSSVPSQILPWPGSIDLDTIGPDGTFYAASTRPLPRAATTEIPSVLQRTIVLAIGVHDDHDPRWQSMVDGAVAGLVAGERNVYLTTLSVPTPLPLAGGNAGGMTSIPTPLPGPANLVLLDPANGHIVRSVNLAGSPVRSLDLKKVGNDEFVYVVTLMPETILTFPLPPPAWTLEIFDADGNRIKQVRLVGE